MNTMKWCCTGHTQTYDTTTILFEIIPIFQQFDKQNDIKILICREHGTRFLVQSRKSKCVVQNS